VSTRILVIDDDEAVRKSFLLALETLDCEVEAVDNGEEGVARVRDGRYDLVYLDLKMPGMSGVEVLREIRSFDGATPVYVVTAFHKEFLSQLAGVADDGLEFELMHKPVGADQLRAATREALARTSA